MDKREQIIEIATALFSELGYENTPLSLICEKANVSKGLISHHFKSKDGLLREIFSKATRLMVEMNSFETDSLSPIEKLEHLLNAFFTQLKTDKLLFEFNLNILVQPSTRSILNDLINERSSFILNSVRSIFDKLDAENSVINSYIFIAELDGISLNYLRVFENYPMDELKHYLLQKYTSK